MALHRMHWLRKIATLDPETDYEEIYRIDTMLEFPWDMNQSLGLALYRTYAVPSIGGLLARTGEFTERTQKRYDDTGLILTAIGENGLDSPEGRAAIRRMNQMHGRYGIPNDDMRYVLSTLVTVPIRWLDEYGYRPLSEAEKVASAHYYGRLGGLMNIRDLPATWQEFGELMDAYEREHFGYDEGAVAVSEATLALMATFPPNDKGPRRLMRRSALALMDDDLLSAFRYDAPTRLEQVLYRGAIKARAALLRHVPARREPVHFADLPQVRSYPDGFEIAALGTFPDSRS
ncbi:MAG TPA: oxygenase MpaB family protein [Dermatophilaceae bacterium]|nr:oxygenase MpaB family protein [Dermatophilaceae bacterium]